MVIYPIMFVAFLLVALMSGLVAMVLLVLGYRSIERNPAWFYVPAFALSVVAAWASWVAWHITTITIPPGG